MAIISWGSCASWGCVQAAKPNPTQATPIHKVSGIGSAPIIKVPGCPPIAEVMTGGDLYPELRQAADAGDAHDAAVGNDPDDRDRPVDVRRRRGYGQLAIHAVQLLGDPAAGARARKCIRSTTWACG